MCAYMYNILITHTFTYMLESFTIVILLSRMDIDRGKRGRKGEGGTEKEGEREGRGRLQVSFLW